MRNLFLTLAAVAAFALVGVTNTPAAIASECADEYKFAPQLEIMKERWPNIEVKKMEGADIRAFESLLKAEYGEDQGEIRADVTAIYFLSRDDTRSVLYVETVGDCIIFHYPFPADTIRALLDKMQS